MAANEIESPNKTDNFSFRLALPEDAPAFKRWMADCKLIDPSDLTASMKSVQPTAVTFAVVKNGVPVVFAPIFATMSLGFLSFNPEANIKDRKSALKVLLRGAIAFAFQFGIRHLTTLSMRGYPVARWAEANGFVPETRTLFKYDLNENVLNAEVEATTAEAVSSQGPTN